MLRLSTAGESHGPRLTAILEGIPSGLVIDPAFVASELARRQHGYGRGGRMKIEKDEALFEGGVRGGVTLGSPIAIGIDEPRLRELGGGHGTALRSIPRRPPTGASRGRARATRISPAE